MKKKWGTCLACGVLSVSAAQGYIYTAPPACWGGGYGGIILGYEWALLKDPAHQLPTKATPKGFGYGLNLGIGTTFLSAIYVGGDFSFIISNASWNAYPVSETPYSAKARQRFTFQLTGQVGIPLDSYMIYAGAGNGWTKYTGNISSGNVYTDLKGNPSSVAWNFGLKQQSQGVMFDFRFSTQPGHYRIKAGNRINVRAYAARLGICYLSNF